MLNAKVLFLVCWNRQCCYEKIHTELRYWLLDHTRDSLIMPRGNASGSAPKLSALAGLRSTFSEEPRSFLPGSAAFMLGLDALKRSLPSKRSLWWENWFCDGESAVFSQVRIKEQCLSWKGNERHTLKHVLCHLHHPPACLNVYRERRVSFWRHIIEAQNCLGGKRALKMESNHQSTTTATKSCPRVL